MPRNRNKFTQPPLAEPEALSPPESEAQPQAAEAADGRAGRPRSKSKRKQQALARLKAQQQQASAAQVPQEQEALGSNWQTLKQKLGQARKPFRRRQAGMPVAAAAPPGKLTKQLDAIGGDTGLTSTLALDCEMVGTGPRGTRSELARVCIINNFGVVILDAYVRPAAPVTDFRTKYSGVRKRNLVGAPSLQEVRPRVAKLIAGRVLIGHALHNDFKALGLQHPEKLVRDTARFPPLMKVHALEGARAQARRLRDLAKEVLGLVIQTGEHSPVDDARAALYLYHRHAKDWEAALAAGRMQSLKVPVFAGDQSGKANGRSLQELAAADDMVDL